MDLETNSPTLKEIGYKNSYIFIINGKFTFYETAIFNQKKY